jgi:hypothetical protein
VFLRLVSKMSDRFYSKESSKFCEKLVRNASDIRALLSETFEGEAMKNSSACE